MSITVQWQQATTYPASKDRSAIRAAMYPDSDTSVRDGCLTVGSLTPSHTSGMSVKVSAGQAMVSGYLVTVDPAETVTLDVGGAQKRTDLVVLRVYDEQEGDATSEGTVEVVKGDPGGATPDLPARSLLIATVSVTATQSTLTAEDIADGRQWTTGRGGVLWLPGVLDQAPPSWMDDGQAVYDTDAGYAAVVDGGAWSPGHKPVDEARKVSTGSGLSGGGDLSANRTLSVDSTVARYQSNVTNWNDATTPGFYYGTSGATNGPPEAGGHTGVVSASGGGGIVIQQVWQAALGEPSMWQRYYNGSWDAWQQVNPPQMAQVTNWSTITRPGFYYGDSSATNGPGDGGYVGWIAMTPGGTWQVQNLSRLTSGTPKIVQRICNGSTWGTWATLHADTGWLNCTMVSGFTGSINARIRNGVFYLKGEVTGTINGPSAVVATLPPAVQATIGGTGYTIQDGAIDTWIGVASGKNIMVGPSAGTEHKIIPFSEPI